jgi:tRNA pseudouridine55 synthase
MYSAIKVDGKKLYELARQGKEIERDRRKVNIKDIRILDYSEKDKEVRVSIDCGKGTYIRTLLYDIGETLECGATMKSLTRTAVGNFTLENALKLSEIEGLVRDNKLEPYIVTLEQVFEIYSKLNVDREFHKLIYNGNSFRKEHLVKPLQQTTTQLLRVYDADDVFIGIYQFDLQDDRYNPVKMFLENKIR